MHFTSSNLLHEFINGKYMLFSLKYTYIYIYIYIHMCVCEKYESTRPATRLTRTHFNPLKMTRF